MQGEEQGARERRKVGADQPAQQPEDLTVLRAKRAVWAFDAGPLPSSGFSLWLGGEQPLIEVKPTGTGPVDKP